jgi:hypothetical protein
MSFGERAALEGVLCQLTPRLAVEIGTAEGGSLTRVAAHSKEVHSFDLVAPRAAINALPNVTLHTGDSHELLPRLLGEFADAGRNVDFVLVDGDHSTEGVRKDVVDLLESAAIAHTIILVHDTANEVVRAGLEQVDFAGYPKVAHVELDFVPGYLFNEPSLRNELWGGLGLIMIDATRTAFFTGPVRQDRYVEAFEMLREARDRRAGQPTLDGGPDIEALQRELEQTRSWLASVQNSASWRATEPLRRVKRLINRKPS